MKNRGLILLILLFIPFVSSTIVIEDNFDNLYNVGDLVNVTFSIQRAVDTYGFVEVILECGKEDFTLKKDYIFIEGDVKKTFSFESPLSLKGKCWVKAIFLNEEQRSPEFEVSDKLILDYTLNDKFFLPHENFTINGSVKKANGNNFNGLIKVVIGDLDEKSVEVINNNFNFLYTIKSDSFPKEYVVEISAVERDSWDKILNSGKALEKIEIRSKATSISINSTEEISPPQEFFFKVNLKDQIGREIENKTVVVKLTNPLGDVVFQKEVASKEIVYYNFTGNAIKGGWNLKAYYEGLVGVKPIYVDENPEIYSFVEGNFLKFQNVGNVHYEGIVKLSLDNESFGDELFLNVSIPINGVYEYPLYYVGGYNLTVDGKDFGFVHLTGNAVLEDFEVNSKDYMIVGAVLLFLILVWYFVFYKKIFRKLESEGQKISETPSKKLIVKESSEDNFGPLVRKTYILFLESNVELKSFQSIVESYGFKMNHVTDTLGYTLFYESGEMNLELKLYNLAKAIMKFSNMKGARTSIVINRGQFEGKVNLLKKFALLNRSLLKYAQGKILMTRKFYEFLKVNVYREDKSVEVLDRKLEICLI